MAGWLVNGWITHSQRVPTNWLLSHSARNFHCTAADTARRQVVKKWPWRGGKSTKTASGALRAISGLQLALASGVLIIAFGADSEEVSSRSSNAVLAVMVAG